MHDQHYAAFNLGEGGRDGPGVASAIGVGMK